MSSQQQLGMQIFSLGLNALMSGPTPEQQQAAQAERERQAEAAARQAEMQRQAEAERQAEMVRQAEARRIAELERLAALERKREQEEREANESRDRLLSRIRGSEASAPLQFRFSSPTLDQLALAAGHGAEANARRNEPASASAREVFDSPSSHPVEAPRINVARPASAPVDTPLMTELRQKLDENKTKRETLKKGIDELRKDPQPSPEKMKEISKKKDELGRAEQEKDYLSFKLDDETMKSTAAAGAPAPQ